MVFFIGVGRRELNNGICQKINNKRVLEVHLQMPVCTFSVCKRTNHLNGLLLQKRHVVGLLFDYPTVVVPGSRQAQQPYGEGPRRAQGGRRVAQGSRR